MNNPKNRPMQQVPGGAFDNFGFYYTPDGSFWDPDGIYFNPEGHDCHGGYYSESLEYCPGPGWIEELMCYEDEKKAVLGKIGRGNNRNDMLDDFDDEGDVDDIYEDIDYDKLLNSNTEQIDEVNLDGECLEKEKTKVYNPKNASNMNMNKNNVITSIKEENENVNEEPPKKEEVKITSDMLFNKIPDNLKPKEVIISENANKENKQVLTKVEKTIEVDSLFG